LDFWEILILTILKHYTYKKKKTKSICPPEYFSVEILKIYVRLFERYKEGKKIVRIIEIM